MIDRKALAKEEAEYAQTQSSVVVLDHLSLEERLVALSQRQASKPRRVDNSLLWANSSMYYYCENCGHLAIVMYEGHAGNIPPLCLECQSLKDTGAILQGPSLFLTSNQVETLKELAEFVIKAQRSGRYPIPYHQPFSGIFADCSMACKPRCLAVRSHGLLEVLKAAKEE